MALLLAMAVTAACATPERPNIVLIYADDLGWGDVGCYGATAVQTPNLDRLAREGLRYTDAHASSATCTPSRFALLTGRYPWRVRGTGVLPGDAALILPPGQPTLPSLLKQAGYQTAVVGKWHLGMGAGPGQTDWNGPIRPGPAEVGFDESFVMPATGDRVPCVYVENGRVVGLDPADPIQVRFGQPLGDEPTGQTHPGRVTMHPSHGHDMALINGIPRIGYMSGGASARWKDEEMADLFARRAVEFIERHREGPFFLYFAPHDIHVPRVPHPRFVGRTSMGPRGDVIAELDDSVGQVMAALRRQSLDAQTLVVFSSDNGAVVDDGYRDDAVARLGMHRPNGPWRGGKYSKFEGGTRVPFIARWMGRIRPGVSDALISQVDLPATLAALVGIALEPGVAPDSLNLLPALLDGASRGRDHVVEHANGLALREGPWKFIPATDGAAIAWETGNETGNSALAQLYNLSNDPGERNNVAEANPDRVRSMAERLDRIRQQGRSR